MSEALSDSQVASILTRLESYARTPKVPYLMIAESIEIIKAFQKANNDKTAYIDSIDAALCNYTNQDWNELTKEDFDELGSAYDEWHDKHNLIGEISMDRYTDNQRKIRESVVDHLRQAIADIRRQKADPVTTIERKINWLLASP